MINILCLFVTSNRSSEPLKNLTFSGLQSEHLSQIWSSLIWIYLNRGGQTFLIAGQIWKKIASLAAQLKKLPFKIKISAKQEKNWSFWCLLRRIVCSFWLNLPWYVLLFHIAEKRSKGRKNKLKGCSLAMSVIAYCGLVKVASKNDASYKSDNIVFKTFITLSA